MALYFLMFGMCSLSPTLFFGGTAGSCLASLWFCEQEPGGKRSTSSYKFLVFLPGLFFGVASIALTSSSSYWQSQSCCLPCALLF